MSTGGALMQPLAAVTPPRHMAHLVASRSYLSYQRVGLQDKLKHNPYSYIQVINPDHSREVEDPRGTPEFFREVRAGYDDFKARGWLKEAPGVEWYVYRQSTEEHSWTGVVCNLDLQACADGGLKTHEQTLEARETLFASFLENVGFHAEPVLCARPDDAPSAAEADSVLAEVVSASAHADFMTADGVRHEIWRVASNSEVGTRFGTAWGACATIYLADGHHRYASSLRLAAARPDLPGASRMLAYVVPERDLTILGYHKEVRNVGLSASELDAALNECSGCDVAAATNLEVTPSKPGQAVVMFQGRAWVLTRHEDSPEATDADWVNVHLLNRMLGITDPRNDDRLRHLPEPQKPEGGWAARAAAKPDRVVVLIHPIPFGHIREVADREGTLPPKSTWVEPKIRSALFIHEFNTTT